MNPLQQEKPLVLVVDDEPEVLDKVATVLTGAGFACRCCTTPENAVEAAQSSPPDLVISDINLHGHGGWEAYDRIRQNKALEHVPVMFLSGTQIPDIIRRSHAVGGTYYLRKPFDPDVLLELVDKALCAPRLAAGHEE